MKYIGEISFFFVLVWSSELPMNVQVGYVRRRLRKPLKNVQTRENVFVFIIHPIREEEINSVERRLERCECLISNFKTYNC